MYFFQIELTKHRHFKLYKTILEVLYLKCMLANIISSTKIYSFVKNEQSMDFLNNLNLDHDFISLNDIYEKRILEDIQVHNVVQP